MAAKSSFRLASIVGVDVVGYSARTEADSGVSAQEVLAVRERVRAVAGRHGGRVFSTAGDGVMMEFPAARQAVAAIFDILDERPADEPLMRIGAHLGDVTVAANRDLLGHGVNVAARLIAAAAPGRALISAELRAAMGGTPRRAMRALGEISLAKMRTRISAFEIEGDSAAPAPAAPEAGVSICVLPFVNVSSDPEQDYFSDGLSEELINQLAQVRTLRVAGRTSSFAFKGKTEDLRVIGQRLGVSHVLEGSVRKTGERLRITAQLIQCSDGFHLWSDKFDRQIADVFAIQDEIAGAVVQALRVTLGIGETLRAPGGTDNIQAHDLMLQAKAIFRRTQLGHASARRAAELARAAVDLDPKFALAWGLLGNALTATLNREHDGSGHARRQIDEAFEQAMRAAPDLWLAHEARGNQLELKHDWVGAEKANARSRAMAPNSVREPKTSRSHQLAIVGRVSESVPFAREAARAEPLAVNTLQLILDLAGRSDEAEAEYERSKEVIGQHAAYDFWGAARMMNAKDHARAKERLMRAAPYDPDPRSATRVMLEVFDDADAARALLKAEIEQASQPLRGFFMSWFAAYFGEHELALQAFLRAAPSLLGIHFMLVWGPLFAPMRALPGFKDLVREFNLVAYWRTTGQWGEFARPLGDDDFEIVR